MKTERCLTNRWFQSDVAVLVEEDTYTIAAIVLGHRRAFLEFDHT